MARAAPPWSAAPRARRRSRWRTAGSRRPRSPLATRFPLVDGLGERNDLLSRSRGTTTTPLPSAWTTSPGRTVTPPQWTGTLIAPRSGVRAGGRVGATGESRQPRRVQPVDVADRPVDDQPDAAEIGQRLADDVADDRGVLAAAAVDEQDVAGGDEVAGLQHVQDVAGLASTRDGRPAYARAARRPRCRGPPRRRGRRSRRPASPRARPAPRPRPNPGVRTPRRWPTARGATCSWSEDASRHGGTGDPRTGGERRHTPRRATGTCPARPPRSPRSPWRASRWARRSCTTTTTSRCSPPTACTPSSRTWQRGSRCWNVTRTCCSTRRWAPEPGDPGAAAVGARRGAGPPGVGGMTLVDPGRSTSA